MACCFMRFRAILSFVVVFTSSRSFTSSFPVEQPSPNRASSSSIHERQHFVLSATQPPDVDPQQEQTNLFNSRRRSLFHAGIMAAISMSMFIPPSPCHARYILDETTGDYIEIEDVDWQTAWKERLEKAQSMSTDQVLQAARGAANVGQRELPESSASLKRRAVSHCRQGDQRPAGVDERTCTAKVLSGDTEWIQQMASIE